MGNGLCRGARVASVLFAVSLRPARLHLTGSGRNMAITRGFMQTASVDRRAAQARSAGSLRRAFRPFQPRPPFPSSSKAPGLPRRAAGEGAACGWIRGARTSPTLGPPPRIARRLQTRRPARPPAVPGLSLVGLPFPLRGATGAPGRGARRPRGLPKAEGRGWAWLREPRPPCAPGPDSPPPHGLQRPWVTLPTHSPGAQVPRGLERAFALGSMAFWSYPVR